MDNDILTDCHPIDLINLDNSRNDCDWKSMQKTVPTITLFIPGLSRLFELPDASPPIKMKTGNKVFDQNAWERIVLYSSYSYIIKLHYMYLESVCRAPFFFFPVLPVRSFCPPLKIMFDTSISGLLHFKTETNSFFIVASSNLRSEAT